MSVLKMEYIRCLYSTMSYSFLKALLKSDCMKSITKFFPVVYILKKADITYQKMSLNKVIFLYVNRSGVKIRFYDLEDFLDFPASLIDPDDF